MSGQCPINIGCLLLFSGHNCMGEAMKRLCRQGTEECLLVSHMKTFILILRAYTVRGFHGPEGWQKEDHTTLFK